MRPAGAPGEADDGQGRPAPARFLPEKRYGFLEPEDGSGNLFRHMSAVAAAGLETLPQGDRRPHVSRIFGIAPPAGTGGARVSRPRVPQLGGHEASPPARDPEMRGTVTFHDAVRGLGFVAPDDRGRDVFIPYRALSQSGLQGMEAGSRVRFRVEMAPRDPHARDVGLL